MSTPSTPTKCSIGSKVLAAVQDELRCLLDQPLTTDALITMQTVAAHCHQMMIALDPEQLSRPLSPMGMAGGIPVGMPYSSGFGMRDETFGSKAVREAVAVLREVADRNRVSDLVSAIAKAESANLTDVAARLRKQLDVALERPTPEPETQGQRDEPTPALTVSGAASRATLPPPASPSPAPVQVGV